jgi:hypothetical protein
VGVAAVLNKKQERVEPGGSITRTVKVRNTGKVVDSVLVDVVGDAAGWTRVEPTEVNLFPGDEAEVTLTFTPPRSSKVLAGAVPFAVRCLSKEDTEGSVVEEGEVEVGSFADIKAEVVPRTKRLRRRGRVELAVDNLGNVPVDARLIFEDPEDQLSVTIEPELVVLSPGRATFLNLTVKPRQTFLRGEVRTIPYQVAVLAPEQPPVYADGVIVQEPLIPSRLLKLLLLLLVLLIALLLLWNTLFKSLINSGVKDALGDDVANAQEAAADAQEAAEQAQSSAQQATGGGAGGGAIGSLPGGAGEFTVTRKDFRLQGSASTFPVPTGGKLAITDLVFGNPGAATGTVVLQRGTDVLMVLNLANFRDIDYHFVTPIDAFGDQVITMALTCQGPTPEACEAVGVYVNGALAVPAA